MVRTAATCMFTVDGTARGVASFTRRLQIMAQVTHFQRQASHDDLVERARQLVPHLRQRVKEMDQLGYLPEATVQELRNIHNATPGVSLVRTAEALSAEGVVALCAFWVRGHV